MAKKVDTDAPPALIIEFRTRDGEVWGQLTAEGREYLADLDRSWDELVESVNLIRSK